MNFTQLYWNDVIKSDLQGKFKTILAPNESVDLYDVCVKQLGLTLAARVCAVCGIRLYKSVCSLFLPDFLF